MSKHNKKGTVMDTENKQVVVRGDGEGRMSEIGEGNYTSIKLSG